MFPSARALWILIMLAVVSLSGCYVLHVARGQSEVMARRQPIHEVLADSSTPAATRRNLQAVLGIRQFAVDRLGLPDNASYRSYADIRRDYVVWNVFATAEFSLTPEQWCFPIAGCVAYRGYFSESKAHRFAERLERRGLDVYVGGVTAYSTLGHFADPVLNTMMHWSETQLAAIIFHELAHQLLYVPGDSKFNEAFAGVVEQEGVRQWLIDAQRHSHGDAPGPTDGEADLQRFLQLKQRGAEFAALLSAARGRLRNLYAQPLPDTLMRTRKAEIFEELKTGYAALRHSWGGRGDFDRWFAGELNNAHLASVATYQDCVPALESLLRKAGNLRGFYAQARELARLEIRERHRDLCGPPA